MASDCVPEIELASSSSYIIHGQVACNCQNRVSLLVILLLLFAIIVRAMLSYREKV